VPVPSDSPFQVFHLGESDVQQTLAAALKRLLSCKSWGEARKIIAQRRVQINGNLCLDPARRLVERDVVKVWQTPRPKPVDETAIRFVHVDDDLVIVEKPAGVTSVRHFEERRMKHKRKQLQPTLEELIPMALAKYLRARRLSGLAAKEAKEPSEAPPTPRKPMNRTKHSPKYLEAMERLAAKLTIIAVHRLDRDTSGLMIFARNRRTATRLGELFRRHAIDRRYSAVVHGTPVAQTFDNHLIRDRGDGHRGSAVEPIPADAQHAITHIRPIEQIGPYTIIECKLETGRTHQIRIHLAEAGHPLCGENIYHRSLNGRANIDTSGAPRQALHSSALRFVHPMSGKILKFTMPWPDDLQRWLDKLKKS
jgi:23S rRNA pseudouridine1911/1915/1917 synthase